MGGHPSALRDTLIGRECGLVSLVNTISQGKAMQVVVEELLEIPFIWYCWATTRLLFDLSRSRTLAGGTAIQACAPPQDVKRSMLVY